MRETAAWKSYDSVWMFITNALPTMMGLRALLLGDIKLSIEWEEVITGVYTAEAKINASLRQASLKLIDYLLLWWRTCCYAVPNKTQVQHSRALRGRHNQCVYTKLSSAFSERQQLGHGGEKQPEIEQRPKITLISPIKQRRRIIQKVETD